MKKEKLITRTIILTTCTAITTDISEMSVKQGDFDLIGSYKSNEDVLAALKASIETETLKVVAVVSYREIKQVYAITEAAFMLHGKLLSTPVTDTDKIAVHVAR